MSKTDTMTFYAILEIKDKVYSQQLLSREDARLKALLVRQRIKETKPRYYYVCRMKATPEGKVVNNLMDYIGKN